MTLTVLVSLQALSRPVPAAELPQKYDYQKTLRNHLATLTAVDFTITPLPVSPRENPTEDQQYEDWLRLYADAHLYEGSANLPPDVFTLRSIESANAVMKPAVNPYHDAQLASWDHPANPYRGSKALRLRAFANAVVDMVMHDQQHEQVPPTWINRSDFMGGTLIWLAYPYMVFKKDLPAPVAAAYEEGLRRFINRINEWGPRGSMTDMDLFAPIGLYLAAQAVGDPKLMDIARDYSKPLFAEPRFFNPAGYFVDNGCFDTSYNGISLYFASYAARVTRWPNVIDAVERAFRLRGHLWLPEPNGTFVGPTHMSSRTSGDPAHDQWGWAYRNIGAALTTDHALCFVPIPTPEQVAGAPAALAARLAPKSNATPPAKPPPDQFAKPWSESHWSDSNFAANYYAPGFYPRLKKLASENSPLLKPPFLRKENFIENFGDVLLVARNDKFGVVIHTGPVSGDDRRWHRPLGFGGGAVSAFWTRDAGAAVLGRRRGIQGRTFDTYDDWRIWPIHAITGVTPAGRVFSSARTPRPEYTREINKSKLAAVVTARGTMNKTSGQGIPITENVDPVGTGPAPVLALPTLEGDIQYERVFKLDTDQLAVTSSIQGDGKDQIAELYETIPVYLGDGYDPAKASPTVDISFEVGGKWVPATPEPVDKISAIRIDRAAGAVLITLSKRARVQLSPQIWTDGYQSAATCRNVMIHMIDKPGPSGRASVSYTMTPAKRP